MPGITGIISKKYSELYENEMKNMVKCMRHEKFYSSGIFIERDYGVYCGWTHHRDSFSDCMPVWNESKEICLIFAGENYYDSSEIDAIRVRGHECNASNASYLVHIYEEYGTRCFEKLNGYFCGLIVDLRQERVILFNDRFGLNRIYYHEGKESFYFSSEAKSLLRVLPSARKFNKVSLGEMFAVGCTLENRTLFEGISMLPGGVMWIFSRNMDVRKKTYFDRRSWTEQNALKRNEYYEEIKETFARILPRYFGGRRSVGVSLTGGIDSRMIMALSKLPPYKVPCYTFGGRYRDCSDVRIARKVAKACQQTHETLTVDWRFLKKFPEMAKKCVLGSDGTMDVSGSVGVYTQQLARKIAPVRITGNYGDQVVRIDVGFKPSSKELDDRIFDSEFLEHVKAGKESYYRIAEKLDLSFFLFKQLPWYHYPRFAMESTQVTMRSPYLDNDLLSVLYRTPQGEPLSKNSSLGIVAEGNPSLSRIPTDRGIIYRPVPVVTWLHNYYEDFTFRAEWAYDHGMPHWLAKIDYYLKFLHLEKLFLGRHKYFHFRIWYREELSEYVKEMILDNKTLKRSYLKGRFLEEMIMDHIKGHRNYTREIHLILTTELIERHLLQ